MHYSELSIRQSVPLIIGLVIVPNPQLPILDTLSKYSHDNGLQEVFKGSTFQAFAVIANSLIAMGEDIGADHLIKIDQCFM